MQKYNFFCYLKKKLYLCITISERVVALNDWKSGEVPEWSNGAVSKTVDQLAGPRVRIPASPLMKISQVPVGKLVRFFVSMEQNGVSFPWVTSVALPVFFLVSFNHRFRLFPHIVAERLRL